MAFTKMEFKRGVEQVHSCLNKNAANWEEDIQKAGREFKPEEILSCKTLYIRASMTKDFVKDNSSEWPTIEKLFDDTFLTLSPHFLNNWRNARATLISNVGWSKFGAKSENSIQKSEQAVWNLECFAELFFQEAARLNISSPRSLADFLSLTEIESLNLQLPTPQGGYFLSADNVNEIIEKTPCYARAETDYAMQIRAKVENTLTFFKSAIVANNTLVSKLASDGHNLIVEPSDMEEMLLASKEFPEWKMSTEILELARAARIVEPATLLWSSVELPAVEKQSKPIIATKSELEAKYIQRVNGWPENTPSPSAKSDHEFLKNLNSSTSRERMRELRNKHAPNSWREAGVKSTKFKSRGFLSPRD
jgi:hypothetical protein